MDTNALKSLERLAALGLCTQWLCGPGCNTAKHGRNGHPPDGAGKIPTRPGWQRLGYRTFDALKAEYKPGANPSILTGWQPSARLSIVVVDCDSAAACAWADQNLPASPWRVRTRRGEHRYYRCTEPTAKRAIRALSIDVMGDGGQVVAPGAVHASGHVYEALGDKPWASEQVGELPIFDSAWFPEPGHTSTGTAAEPKAPTGGTWPGKRLFSRSDYSEAWERAIMYLSSPHTPVSVSGQGGDQTLYNVALKLLRGFPLASEARYASLTKPAPVDACDAQTAAISLLREVWNPRCVDSDGESPYPWDLDRLHYKVGQAASASHLPGPDYWLFDDSEARERYARKFGGSFKKEPPEAATSEGQEIPMDETTTSKVTPSVDPVKAAAEAYRDDAARFSGLSDLPSAAPEAHPEQSAQPTGPAPTITYTVNVAEMVDAAEFALGNLPSIFSHKGKIVELLRQPGTTLHGYPHRPKAHVCSYADIYRHLSGAARWVKQETDKEGNVRERAVEPHRMAVKALQDLQVRPTHRPIHGIVHTPVLRPDGSLLQTPGYDERTGLLYLDDELPLRPINERPNRWHCAGALATLLDVVGDFPFTAPDLAKSVWLSAVLTRFCRHAITGNVPLFAVAANCPGAGKGKVVDSACVIGDGRESATETFVGDAAEDDRRILAHDRAGTPSVCLDNIATGTPLSSPAYERALTSTHRVGRVVGSSEIYASDLSPIVWWATGNGLRTAGDMSRRVLRIDIQDDTGAPSNRKVRHTDLIRYCRNNRAQLVRAALTLLSGWIAAGRPRQPLPAFASYEQWSDIVRQCVVWCGLPDPLLARGAAAGDETQAAREDLYRHLLPFGKVGVAELETILSKDSKATRPRHADFLSFLLEEKVNLSSDAKSAGKSLGNFLAKHYDQVIVLDGKRHKLLKKRGNAGFKIWVEVLPS